MKVWRGKDPAEGHWGCPIRERWGLSAHQQLSPALEDKLAYFGTVAPSYEAAAKLAAKLGYPVEDTTIRALVQRLGAKAEAQVQTRLKNPPLEKVPVRAPTPLAVLMLDGFQVRFRGPGWGRQKTTKTRVEWHEMKLGVFYRHEQAVAGERGQLAEKVLVGWQGEGLELGRRSALGSATRRLGAGARGVGRGRRCALDLERGGRPLGRGASVVGLLSCQPTPLVAGRSDASQRRGGAPGLGGSAPASLASWAGAGGAGGWPRCPAAGGAGKIIRREQNYFAGHAGRMNYQRLAQRGWPIGSGAVESGCRTRQCRRKRPGQFWTRAGLRHLDALEEARDNGHWDQLWLTA